jgi:hypothetical protein
VANISPGERLNLKMAGREWLIGFYMVREHGVPLLGPPPGEVIESISRDEFLDSVRRYLPWQSVTSLRVL